MALRLFVLVVVFATATFGRFSPGFFDRVDTPRRASEFKIMPGHKIKENFSTPLPHTYLKDVPDQWFWGNVSGVNYLTKSLNQHIPQYCGSCWAHGALSALGDRIKIARHARPIDVNLAVQYILNCGGDVAGSCNGGSASGVYEFIKQTGFVPYDTCMGYAACSSDSEEGDCPKNDWSCSAINTCRTCSTFKSEGGFCSALDTFPNASIAEYGSVTGEKQMMAEIYARGPIACGVDATQLVHYTGGIIDDNVHKSIDHIISIVGYGTDAASGKKYWIVRNSWGEYWGEMGYFRVVRGSNQLGLESMCNWATPASWTEHNFACFEDGTNCVKKGVFVDPFHKFTSA
eukprot:gnl/Spiro4/24208_TR12019_c0_g1_i1.p1 gnl/Spiro4/24208_TR12019_c0_g1~~gnl/Spiro4/24208_TR12019_c0_g1_i1.p1  ORF type:complete len:356 (+),score=77.29 gnl/Spiro4/24208_TR12019_c0_g1_i1:34-1068(+)